MNTAQMNGIELAYTVRGTGEPVLFLHCSFIADAFVPLLQQPALPQNYQYIHYHRRGYHQSRNALVPASMEDQAQDGLALLDYLGIPVAHIVGHSHGADVAIQMAVTSPKTVATLTLLEPPVPFLISPDALNLFLGVIGQAMASYGAGDKKGTLDTWLGAAFGSGWEEVVEQTVPGGYTQALADVDAAILVDAASTQTWNLQPEHLRAITQPVLSAFHVDPVWKGFEDVHQGLATLLPHLETLVVPNTTHLMQIQNPRSVAEGLASFLARHPIFIHA